MKTCSICKSSLPLNEFNKLARSKDGLCQRCKPCDKARQKSSGARYYADNKDKVQKRQADYRANNKEKLKARSDKYQAANKEEIRRRQREIYAKNPQKKLEQQAKYRAANPEKILEQNAKYRNANPGKQKEATARWRAANPEKMRERRIRYYAANLESCQAKWRNSSSKRRAMMAKNGVYFVSTKEIAKLIYSPCTYCSATDNITIDHVIPIARGGTHGIGNLASACRSCNLSKNKKFITEWRKHKCQQA